MSVRLSLLTVCTLVIISCILKGSDAGYESTCSPQDYARGVLFLRRCGAILAERVFSMRARSYTRISPEDQDDRTHYETTRSEYQCQVLIHSIGLHEAEFD